MLAMLTLPTWRDSCFIENCAFGYVLHSLHKRKLPCVPRYFLFFKLNSSFPMLYAKYLWRRFGHGHEQFHIPDKSSVLHLNLSLANFYIRRCNMSDLTGKMSALLSLHNRTKLLWFGFRDKVESSFCVENLFLCLLSFREYVTILYADDFGYDCRVCAVKGSFGLCSTSCLTVSRFLDSILCFLDCLCKILLSPHQDQFARRHFDADYSLYLLPHTTTRNIFLLPFLSL